MEEHLRKSIMLKDDFVNDEQLLNDRTVCEVCIAIVDDLVLFSSGFEGYYWFFLFSFISKLQYQRKKEGFIWISEKKQGQSWAFLCAWY